VKILVAGYQGMLAQELLPRLHYGGFKVVGKGLLQLDETWS
jgi:hypothetical protein